MRLTNFQGRDKLRKGNKKEIKIKEKLELFVEDQREECGDVIFLVANHIWRKFSLEFILLYDVSTISGDLNG